MMAPISYWKMVCIDEKNCKEERRKEEREKVQSCQAQGVYELTLPAVSWINATTLSASCSEVSIGIRI
jgi:hypothetical protein